MKRLHRIATSSLEEGFHYKAFLREEGGAVGDGRSSRNLSFLKRFILTRSPSPDSVGSSLPEGATKTTHLFTDWKRPPRHSEWSEESSNNPAKQDFSVKRLHREAISSLEEGFHSSCRPYTIRPRRISLSEFSLGEVDVRKVDAGGADDILACFDNFDFSLYIDKFVFHGISPLN